jgi:hypothetical protein
MIFAAMTLLEKKLPIAICHQHGDRAVLAPINVRLKLGGCADVIAVRVDKDNAFVFINHGSKPCFAANRAEVLRNDHGNSSRSQV